MIMKGQFRSLLEQKNPHGKSIINICNMHVRYTAHQNDRELFPCLQHTLEGSKLLGLPTAYT
jgi:hypothetical protein